MCRRHDLWNSALRGSRAKYLGLKVAEVKRLKVLAYGAPEGGDRRLTCLVAALSLRSALLKINVACLVLARLRGGSAALLSPLDGTMRTVRFWLNAFIPNSVCELCGDTYALRAPNAALFAGDQREFSDDPSALARAHSEVIVDGLAPGEEPVIGSQVHVCGETHLVDADGSVLGRATAPTDRMLFQNLRGAQTVDPEGGVVDGIPGSVQLDFEGSTANPLFTLVFSPDIDWSGTLTIDREGGRVLVKGAVNDFPAFEMYCVVDDGPVLTLVQKGPVTPLDLIGDENRAFDGVAPI